MAVDTSLLHLGSSPESSPDMLRQIWLKKAQNLKLAWQEFTENRVILESMPSKVIVELTQNCNYRCVMCQHSKEEKFQRYNPDLNMPIEEFVRVADQIFPSAVFVDLRGFGETTILPYWPEVVDYLSNFPLTDWHLVTNLSLNRDDVWIKMMRLGFSLGFSCDGATKETFESIRVRSKFEQIRHNLRVVETAIGEFRRGFIYFISTIQKSNVHEMRKLVEMAREFSIREVQFKAVKGDLNQELFENLDPTLVAGYVNEALDAALDLGVRVTFNDWFFTRNADPGKVARAAQGSSRNTPPSFPSHPSFWDGSPKLPEEVLDLIVRKVRDSHRVSAKQRCFKPYSYIYVSQDSQIGPCNHMMYPSLYAMGDLRTQPLKEIWNCEKYQDFRRQLVTATPSDDRCRWCFQHRMED